jgi:hypothetical protein
MEINVNNKNNIVNKNINAESKKNINNVSTEENELIDFLRNVSNIVPEDLCEIINKKDLLKEYYGLTEPILYQTEPYIMNNYNCDCLIM